MSRREDFLDAERTDEQQSAYYHEQRRQKIANGESLLGYPDAPGFVFHVIPEGTFDAEDYYRLNIEAVEHDASTVPTDPHSGAGYAGSFTRTATGKAVQKTSNNDEGETVVGRYAHTSTTGIIEAVSGQISYSRGNIDGEQVSATSWEAMVVSSAQNYTTFLADNGIEGPFEVQLSLFNMANVAFVYDRGRMPGRTERFASDTVAPFPTTVEAQDSGAEMWVDLKPILESVWRAAGCDSIYTEDANGDWELDGNY